MRLLCAADGDELGGALGHEERAVSVAGDVAVLEDQPALLDDARPELVLLDLAAGENNDTNSYDTQLFSSPLVLLDPAAAAKPSALAQCTGRIPLRTQGYTAARFCAD